MWEGPAHWEWCHSGAGGPGLYKKAGRASRGEEASQRCPALLLLPTLSSCLDFLHDALWYGSISMGNPFLLESGFDECFITTVKSSRAPPPVTWDPFALGI